ncbi:TPA: protein-disulfide oxidoreductase DsbI [Citrobacter koseri]|nr:protein-disulfide oxidoreductase DsbI [Citrobacter koseri]
MRFFKDFTRSPINTLYRWQNSRLLWSLMIVIMGGLVIIAHSFFQIYLYMNPCEQCVYIRFAMLVMVAGSIVACINPMNLYLKLTGVIFCLYGSITGLQYSFKLNHIHHAVHGSEDALFGVQGCSTDPSFPFGLPLAEWAPEWFKPTGDCGYDAPTVPVEAQLDQIQSWFVNMYVQADGWYLIPSLKFMNMAQACALAFGVCLLILVVMICVWVIIMNRNKRLMA